MRISVPRFLCLNNKCSRVTFSVLSRPCLRYKRHTLAFYFALLRLLALMKASRLASKLGKTWSMIRRWKQEALTIRRFLDSEGQREPWGPCPCRHSSRYWPAFTRDLYRACRSSAT